MGMSLQDVFGRLRMVAAVQTLSGLSDGELVERFLSARDESAFTVLIERHGPMVLGVCRRSLASHADVEDACQATFLVLARKASSLRQKESLASWIHSVVCRVVIDLKRDAARRKSHEERVDLRSPADPAVEVAKQEFLAILDEELGRLPERYRAPLILCYLERLPREMAAARLGLSLGRLHGRLDRGRGFLRQRLTKRGLTLSALLSGPALGDAAALPPMVVISSARAAGAIASGEPLIQIVSAHVLSLTRGAFQSMVVAILKLGTAAVLGTALLALVGGTFRLWDESHDKKGQSITAPTKKESDEDFPRRISEGQRDPERLPADIHLITCTNVPSKKTKSVSALFI